MILESLLKPVEQKLPNGTYNAITGGSVAVVQYSVYSFSIKFPGGVRGFNIVDTVTVTDEGITSNILGSGGEY